MPALQLTDGVRETPNVPLDDEPADIRRELDRLGRRDVR